MSVLLALLFVLAGLAGTGVALTRSPRQQVLAIAVNGLVLALLFLALQAPDVAFSELTSSYGHDAFLVEVAEQTELVKGFLASTMRRG